MGQGLRALSGSLFRAHGDFGRTVMELFELFLLIRRRCDVQFW